MLYEGTPRTVSYTYSGVLAYASPSNSSPTGTGADWANVCTIRPVQTKDGAGAIVRKGIDGEIHITVPVPSEAEALLLKAASKADAR
jgi:hypothetical protein